MILMSVMLVEPIQMNSEDSTWRSSARSSSRRLFVQSIGVAGLGLIGGKTATAEGEDRNDNSAGVDAEETEANDAGPAENDEEATKIDSCTVIDEPGEYELVADLSPTELDQPACIVIDSDDVSLYGNGHAIDLTETTSDTWRRPSCITIHSAGRTGEVDWNVMIENVELRGGSAGVESIHNFNQELSFADVTAVGNDYGFHFDMSGGSLENCVLANNDVGFRLEGDTHTYGQSAAVTVERSTFRSNASIGLEVGEFGEAEVVASRIVANGTGVRVSAAAGEIEGTATLQECHICRNEHYGVDAGATQGPGEDAGPGEEPGPWVAEVDSTDCYWGVSNGPSSLAREYYFQDDQWTGRFEEPEEPFTDPGTGRPADGDGDAISQSLEPGVSNVRFDPFQESTLEDVGADR